VVSRGGCSGGDPVAAGGRRWSARGRGSDCGDAVRVRPGDGRSHGGRSVDRGGRERCRRRHESPSGGTRLHPHRAADGASRASLQECVPRHPPVHAAAAGFGDVAGNLFGLDSGAQIGLEYRFGIVRNGEAGIHRTSDKTIEFFSQYGIVRQTATRHADVSVLVSVEGTNNFRDQYSPAVAALVSRTFGERAAVYVEPTWVHHANVQPDTAVTGTPNDTVMVGLGGRFRVRSTVSIVTEFSPRLSGFRPGINHGGVAIEKRAGGHTFQLNISDSFATTMGQIARGGPAGTNWHLGFNISRKFF
jgi:hypothetical protein